MTDWVTEAPPYKDRARGTSKAPALPSTKHRALLLLGASCKRADEVPTIMQT